MGLHADPVARPVDEVAAEAGVGDPLPPGPVDLLGRCAHGRGPHRRGLGLVEHRIGLQVLPLGPLPHPDAAGDVGAVADAVVAHHRPAEVAQHRLAAPDDPITGLVMGARGVLTRGHDREVHPIVSLGEDLPPEFGRHLGLRGSDEGDLPGLQPGRDPVDGVAGHPEALDLLGRLDGTDGAGDGAGPPEVGLREPADEVDEEPGPHVIADGHLGRPAHQIGDDADRVLGLGPGPHPEDVGPLRDPGRLQRGHHERGLGVAGNDEHGDPLERHRLVAAEVGKVGPDRQQQHVDPVGRHPLPGSRQTLDEHDAEARGSTAAAACRAW